MTPLHGRRGFLLGSRSGPAPTATMPGVHHPAYDFNDAPIPYGVSLWAKVMKAGMPVR